MSRRPTVVVVDDDEAVLATTEAALRDDYVVRGFTSAADALRELEALAPDAIVSDIVMPRVGGFELRRQYAARFGGRRTPFLFLSSLTDADTMIAGLDAGADDYLTKPVVPELLRARLRAAIRRATPPEPAAFRGDLARMPFVSLLQFCEAKAFTGELAIEAPGVSARLPLRAGELDLESADPWLDRLCALSEGRYALRPASPDFSELEQTEWDADAAASGRVTTLRVRDKLLHLETEIVPGDPPTIVTLVLAGTTPVAKLRRRAPDGATGRELQRVVDAQHDEMRAATQDRISAARQQRQSEHTRAPSPDDAEPRSDPPAPAPRAPAPPRAAPSTAPPLRLSGEMAAPHASRAAALVEDGFELYRKGDYLGALTRWEAARQLDPESRTLAVNIAVARRKLEAPTE